MKSKQLPFYFITISIFLLIVSPTLLSDGMFSDGLLYALISNNLANGIGDFWNLHATSTFYTHFNEHPPLAFWIQSLFFKLFGNSILVERLYSVSTFFITGIIIIKIWQSIAQPFLKSLAWIPLIFWISIPLITWSASNNMLENTMMIFVSLSILFALRSLDYNRILNISFAGLMLFLGLLSKGIVALFPLSIFLWIYIFTHKLNFKRFVINTLILLATTLLPLMIILFVFPQSNDSLYTYFRNQVIGSINNIQTVDNRFYIIIRLLKELIPIFILVIIVFVSVRKNHKETNRNIFYMFLFLGLSGVIPIMVSLKQSGYYILATFPLFSIAFALLIAPNIYLLIKNLNIKSRSYKIFKSFSILFLIASIIVVLMQINKVGRDKNKLEDIYTITKIVPRNSIISIQKSLWTDWSLHGYFYRSSNISIDEDKPFTHQFALVSKGNYNKDLSSYRKVPIELNLYDLYKKE